MNVKLESITLQEDQVRKETRIDHELIRSITVKGILQPLLVRPSKGQPDMYELICGHRRYKAATELGLTEVPVIIRDIEDHEIVEIQLMENLQRAEMDLFDEADAIQELSKRGITNDEIAMRIGKSNTYVRSRFYLSTIGDYWRKAHAKEPFTIVVLTAIAQLSVTDRKTVEKAHKNKEDLRRVMKSLTSKISSFIFDTNDEDLIANMGACTGCQYNTTGSLLFDADQGYCTNITCKLQKDDAHMFKLIDQMLEKGGLFMYRPYNCDELPKEYIDRIKDAGRDITSVWDARQLSLDAKMTYEEWRDDEYWPDDRPPLKELKQEYKQYCDEYANEKDKYEKDVKGATIGLMLNGNNKGMVTHYILDYKKDAKSSDNSNGEGTPQEEAAGQIEAIKTREKRKKELDADKFFKSVRQDEAFMESYITQEDGKLTDAEWLALTLLLYNQLLWDDRDDFRKVIRLRKSSSGSDFDIYNNLKKKSVDKLPLAHLIRKLIVTNMSKGQQMNHSNSASCAASLEAWREFNPELVEQYDQMQKEIAKERAAKVKKRIAGIRIKAKKVSKTTSK